MASTTRLSSSDGGGRGTAFDSITILPDNGIIVRCVIVCGSQCARVCAFLKSKEKGTKEK